MNKEYYNNNNGFYQNNNNKYIREYNQAIFITREIIDE